MPLINKKKGLVWLVVTLDLLVIAMIVFLIWKKRGGREIPAQPSSTTTESVQTLLPTRTPEEVKVISQIETKTIEIKNNTFTPATLGVKVHDQVQWHNADQESHQLKGEGWQSLPLKPDANFTRSFNQAGTYPYRCLLHSEMQGTIVVK